MLKVTKAIILAGGLGTRLHNTVPDLPKPMAPVNGRPFLEYQIDYWIAQGINHFIISVGYLREKIIAHFGSSYNGAQIDYAIETSPKGTGGGLMLAVEKLEDQPAILLLNGDTFFEVSLSELFNVHSKCKSDWTFSLFRTTETGRYMGIDRDADGRITSLNSNTEKHECFANGGVYLVKTKIIVDSVWSSDQKLSIENDIMPTLLKAGAMLYGQEFRGRFIDIGIPEDYFRSARILEH